MMHFIKKFGFFALSFLLPIIASAQEPWFFDPPEENAGGGQPLTEAQDLGSAYSDLYTFGVSVVGLVAFAAIVFAGLEYIVSAGNASRQSDAKDRIQSAIYGIILLIFAAVLFNTINPQILGGG